MLVIALLVIGPKQLPEVGKSLGKGMREFKESISGEHRDDDDDADVSPPLRPRQVALRISRQLLDDDRRARARRRAEGVLRPDRLA